MIKVENHIETIQQVINQLATDNPSRELDCRVWCASTGDRFDIFRSVVPNFSEWQAPYYTQSVDHAMSLIPCGWHPFRIIWVSQVMVTLHTDAQINESMRTIGKSVHMSNAICIAALKARKIMLENNLKTS